MIFLALICLALIGALVYEKRQNADREKEWALERGALLQRIQAPEVAVMELGPDAEEEPQYARFDDDEFFAQ